MVVQAEQLTPSHQMAYRSDPIAPFFRPIPFQVAEITIIKCHYLHRSCQITWAFGAYMGNRLKGVLTIGKPPSWSLKCGLLGASKQEFKNPECRAHDVYELNRLWMHNDMPKNSESRFVAWCLREVRKLRPRLILVSYADTKKNHIGVIYQATNWIYTGTNTAFKDIHPEGYSDHRSVPISVRGEKIGRKRAWALDPSIPRVPRSTKHRYVWFSDSRDRSLLAWEVIPYPKSSGFDHQFFQQAGASGGRKAANNMSSEERRERAQRAAMARGHK
jgi:hypothetical protein